MRVSVIVPCYNAAPYVGEAVISALAQPETAELLLIEDGSSDASLSACRQLAESDGRVRLLRHRIPENRGAAEARNLGVRQVRCEYVAFLDADDYYLPGRFEPARRMFSEDPGLDGVYDAVGTHFESDAMRQWWLAQRRQEITMVPDAVAPEALFDVLLSRASFHTNGIVVRTELFDRTGLFDTHLRMTQDFAMWIKMAAVGRLLPGSLAKPVAMRRLHGENRIVRNAVEHRAYAFLMWQTLTEWAQCKELPSHRRRLAMCQLHAWGQMDAEQRRALTGTTSESRFMVHLAYSHTGCLRYKRYWRRLARACGGSRLRAFTGRCRIWSS